MSTLISAHNSDGCIGRCDAKCYDATGPVCDCICGGRNHGAGIDKARENTAALADEMIEEYKKEKGADIKCKVNREVYQLKLF